jgi:hypothetical protein
MGIKGKENEAPKDDAGPEDDLERRFPEKTFLVFNLLVRGVSRGKKG